MTTVSMGMLTGLALIHPGHDWLYAALAVGFLGGYSTFSTASVECARTVAEQLAKGT
jgi:CrcB protein